jgi:hypothetical protein
MQHLNVKGVLESRYTYSKSIKYFGSVILLLLAITGCASGPVSNKQVTDFINSGLCESADSVTRSNYIGIDLYYMLSKVERCRGNTEKAISFLELTAAYGQQDAINELQSMGRNVPARITMSLPPVVISPRESIGRGNVPTTYPTASRQSNIEQSALFDGILIRTEDQIGARLCHYSDGSVLRIEPGTICLQGTGQPAQRQSSRPTTPLPQVPVPGSSTPSNAYLLRVEDRIGERQCHYSDGSISRINPGTVCATTP